MLKFNHRSWLKDVFRNCQYFFPPYLFFFCPIKQRRSPKSSKSQTIEEIVVYQPPADESRRWTSSNDRDSVDINTAIYIYMFAIKKTWDAKLKRFYLQHSEINMTFIFTIFATETFCERFLLQYVQKGAIGLLLIIVEAMPILPQFLIQSTKVFHLKIRPRLTPQVQTDTIKSMFLSSEWKKRQNEKWTFAKDHDHLTLVNLLINI